LYEKRFGRVLRGEVPSVEDRLRSIERKKEVRRAERRKEREAQQGQGVPVEKSLRVVSEEEPPPF